MDAPTEISNARLAFTLAGRTNGNLPPASQSATHLGCFSLSHKRHDPRNEGFSPQRDSLDVRECVRKHAI